ncbi:MAG: Ig-like domain-containing protein [archaeon]|nr:Ig-like domain-containing protein [archaeon]
MDIKFGDTVVAIVGVPDDATGVVYFSLDNETWIPVTIQKGKNSVEYDIPDLDAGNYILFVKYSGDDKYNSVYRENPFSVNQLKTTVTVDPVKGKAGEKVKITARVKDESGNPVEEGTVIIGFNGKEYKANIVNGIATIEVILPNKAGNYSATVYYEGFNYNSSYTTFTVEVSDIPGPNPDPNPTPINNSVGNMENTGNPILVLIIALSAIGLESFRRKF